MDESAHANILRAAAAIFIATTTRAGSFIRITHISFGFASCWILHQIKKHLHKVAVNFHPCKLP